MRLRNLQLLLKYCRWAGRGFLITLLRRYHFVAEVASNPLPVAVRRGTSLDCVWPCITLSVFFLLVPLDGLSIIFFWLWVRLDRSGWRLDDTTDGWWVTLDRKTAQQECSIYMNLLQWRGQPQGYFFLHFCLSPVSSSFNRRSFMSCCIATPHRFFCRPTTAASVDFCVIILFLQFLSSLLISWTCHLNMESRILSVMYAIPSVFLMT